MKILMVNKFLYPRGGSESYMLKLGQQLLKLGHEVEYFGMYDEQNTVFNSAGMYTQNMDFHSKGLARFLYPFKIIYSFEAKRKISKVLDEFRPDIVHMNNINFQLTPSIIYAVKKRKIPLVQTVHDYQMICPNHLFYSFSESKPCTRCLNGSKWNCLKFRCIHNSTIKSFLGVLESLFYSAKKTYKKVDLYICPSSFLEKKLEESSAIYNGKTFKIHNFIEKGDIKKEGQNQKPYIVFVGRLSKEKGVSLLAQVAKLMPDYNFVVAGNGPDEDVLYDIENVRLTGFLTGNELKEVMENSKLLIAPSVCFENCPLSILEAHSMGIPVVTMNSGGMAELVKDSITGTLVSYPDAEHIKEAIKKTIDDDDYYNTLKENCIKESENILTVETYCDILLERYKDLISGR